MHDITIERYERRELAGGSATPALGVHVTGAQLLVSCEGAACSHEVLVDPQPLFGSRRFWPVSGRSERFRCRCGSRETRLRYTAGLAERDEVLDENPIRLWA